MSTQTVTKNYYAQLGINGNIKTGAVNHDVTLALDKAWHSIEGAKNMYNNGSMGSVRAIFTAACRATMSGIPQ